MDPITRDIIQNSLAAAADEMFAVIRRTAMSTIISEVLDMGTGLTDAKGELICSGAGIPTFVGMLDKAVRAIIRQYDEQDKNFSPGDIFILNDPYCGGVTHCNDIVLAKPLIAENDSAPIAWAANTAHWNDIGGMAPGSMSTLATEIYQEGLRLPPVKLFENDTPVAPVFDLLKANSRMPDFLEGDLWAQVAALRLGERRVLELVSKYGREPFLSVVEDYLDYGEHMALAGLREIPEGRYETSESDGEHTYSLSVTITKDTFTVDLRDCPDQLPGPYNLSREGAEIASQMALKSVTTPRGITNGGSFRPLRLLTRPGSVFEPDFPAAMGFYYEVRIKLLDLILKALAKAVPHLVPAGHFASIGATMIGGTHPETGRSYCVIEPCQGGWGGSAHGDGNPAMFSASHGETYNCPAEVAERRHGIMVERYELNTEPGGEGQHRGGNGIRKEYKILADNSWLTASYSRTSTPPWPLNGGRPGSLNRVEVERKHGGTETYAEVTGLELNSGDIIRVVTATGAGWGNPKDRAKEQVLNDVKNEYITQELADKVYNLS